MDHSWWPPQAGAERGLIRGERKTKDGDSKVTCATCKIRRKRLVTRTWEYQSHQERLVAKAFPQTQMTRTQARMRTHQQMNSIGFPTHGSIHPSLLTSYHQTDSPIHGIERDTSSTVSLENTVDPI